MERPTSLPWHGPLNLIALTRCLQPHCPDKVPTTSFSRHGAFNLVTPTRCLQPHCPDTAPPTSLPWHSTSDLIALAWCLNLIALTWWLKPHCPDTVPPTWFSWHGAFNLTYCLTRCLKLHCPTRRLQPHYLDTVPPTSLPGHPPQVRLPLPRPPWRAPPQATPAGRWPILGGAVVASCPLHLDPMPAHHPWGEGHTRGDGFNSSYL